MHSNMQKMLNTWNRFCDLLLSDKTINLQIEIQINMQEIKHKQICKRISTSGITALWEEL